MPYWFNRKDSKTNGGQSTKKQKKVDFDWNKAIRLNRKTLKELYDEDTDSPEISSTIST